MHTRDHARDETGSGTNDDEPAQPSGLPFVEDNLVILYDIDGEEMSRYKTASGYLKAIKSGIAKVPEVAREWLTLNQPGANHWINQDKGFMVEWESCWAAANEAEVAQGSMA